METGHRQLGPLTRAVNSGSGNRALHCRQPRFKLDPPERNPVILTLTNPDADPSGLYPNPDHDLNLISSKRNENGFSYDTISFLLSTM